MSDNVVKEFLVKLGFDAKGADGFSKQIDSVSKDVAELGVAVAAMGAAITAVVAKMTSDFDKLYWSSKNLGATAGEVKAVGYAWSQLGGSVEGAGSAMQSIANFMQTYGGGAAGFMTKLGVAPQDIGDAAKTMRDLEVIFQRMVKADPVNGPARATAIASAFGWSPDQVRVALRDTGEYEKQFSDTADQMGTNLDQAAKAANELATQMRRLRSDLELWVDNAGIAVIENLGPRLKEFAEWVSGVASGKDTSKAAVEIREIVTDLGKLGDALDALATSDAMEKFAVKSLFGFDQMIKSITQMTKIVNDVINGNWSQAYTDALTGIAPPGTRVATNGDTRSGFINQIAEWRDQLLGYNAGAGSAGGSGFKNGVGGIVGYFMGQGFTAEQAAGIRAGISAEGGGVGMAANGAFGIGQWRGSRYRALVDRYGPSPTMQQQLEFLAWELNGGDRGGAAVHGAGSAMAAMHAYLEKFMRPQGAHNEHLADLNADLLRGAAALANPFAATLGGAGHRSVNFNQTNHYAVSGADHPSVVAGVGEAQERSNQKMINTVSVWQW